MKKQLSPRKWFILVATLILGNSYCFSQVTQPMNFLDWTGTAGSQNFFQKNLTKTDGSGNVYVCGATINGNGDYDLLIAKYNNSGVQQWINQYAGAGGGNDFATGLWIDGSSNVYVTGSALNSSADSNDVITIKYNSSGTQQWAVLYNGGYGNDGGSDITVDGSGNVYVSGATNTGTSTYFDGLLIKYNSSGTQQYVKTFDNNNLNDGAYRVSLLTSNRVAIACIAQATSTTYKFASVRYTATTGAFIASSVSASLSIGFKMVTGCVTDAAHNMYVTGWEYNVGTGFDYRTIKLDSALNQIWTVSFDGASHQDDQSNGIAMDGSGNVYVTGYSTGANGKDYATVKYNSSGTQQWVEYYNDPDDSDDVANAIVLDNNGLPVVTGYHYNGSSKDYHTIKYDASGAVVWSSDYNGLANKDDRAFDIACDGNNDIFVTGQTQTASLTLEYTTVKYVQKDVMLPDDTIAYTSNSFVFTENRGQLRNTSGDSVPQIRYYTICGSPKVYFTDTAVSYLFAKLDSSSSHLDTLTRVDMKFIGANANLKVHPMDVRDEYENFFLGHIPDGRSRVQNYDKLVSFNVWNNVDMVYGSNLKGLKYYFICKPGGGGGAYTNIDLKYTGADSVKIDTSGRLIIYTKQGNIVQPKPAAWQLDASGNYSSLGWQPSYAIVATNEVKFTSLGSYNTSLPLILAVDWGGSSLMSCPTGLPWSSFYGTGANTTVTSFRNMRVLSTGEVLLCGSTNDPNFPTTTGPWNTNSGSAQDALIVALHPDGVLFWSTYYGGNLDNLNGPNAMTSAMGIDANPSNGNIFFTGSTDCPDFPHQQWGSAYNLNSYAGGTDDQYMVALTSNGQTKLWSTWYGGSGTDQAFDLRVSQLSPYDVYMVGFGGSGYPLLNATYSSGGGTIVRFNSVGGRHWATFFGPTAGGGVVHSVDVDHDNNIVVAGHTSGGSGFPILNPGGNSTFGGGNYDAFVAKFQYVVGTLFWSTYLGGTGDEVGQRIVSTYNGSTNNYYVVGFSTSTSGFPMVNPGFGAYSQAYGGGFHDAFVGQFNQNGGIPWATYFGGPGDEYGEGITVDSDENIYIAGETWGSGGIPFPATNLSTYGGYVSSSFNGGADDGFIAGFASGIHKPIWTTYYGGADFEYCYAIRADGNTKLYIAGEVDCVSGFPLCAGTPNAFGTPINDQLYVGIKTFMSEFDLSPVIISSTIENPLQLDLSVYPNPANNSIWISGNIQATEDIDIEIFNLLGQSLHEEKMQPCETINRGIDLSSLANGVYILYVKSGNRIFTKKVIVQR